MTEKLITPSTTIIGSKKAPAKTYDAEKKYNKEINNHPEIIGRLKLRDNFVMVRPFKYEQDPVTEGGIILQDMKEVMTEGGRKRSELTRSEYQLRAVIVATADNLKEDKGLAGQLKAGDVVHLTPGTYKEFNVRKEVEVSTGDSYYLVHAGAIDCIELPKN